MAHRHYLRISSFARLLVVVLAVVYGSLRALPHIKGSSAAPSAVAGSLAVVSYVTDGDTIRLADGRKVRLIGVDTPELHQSEKLSRDAKRSREDSVTIRALGQEAYLFTKSLVLGRRIRVEYDIVRQDRYGRDLAYIYLDDGLFVNAEIVRQGYGQVMTIPPNVRYADDFVRLEREARENGRGLWKELSYRTLADAPKGSRHTQPHIY